MKHISEIVQKIMKEREEMDKQFIQERMDQGIYEYDPYTEHRRPAPEPSKYLAKGLSRRARQIIYDKKFGVNK